MIGSALQFLGSLTIATGELVLDATSGFIDPRKYISIRPESMRRLLLNFEDSIQGKIPEILGDDHEERVETLVRLLAGTTTQDMNELLQALQEALGRMAGRNGRIGVPD